MAFFKELILLKHKDKYKIIVVVGVIVGGSVGMDLNQESEVFVPGQVCQKELPTLPFLKVALPIVVILKGLLVVCAKHISTTVCYKYVKASGAWDLYTTTPVNHDYCPGVVLNEKLYVYQDKSPQIFDPEIQKWNKWERPATRVGFQACMTVVNGKIYLIGGILSKLIQVFDPNAAKGQGWTKVAELPSMSYNRGCSVMATGTDIMIAMNSSPKNVVIFHTNKNQFSDARCQFHQHFMHEFFVRIFLPKPKSN
jgi:hypothetical protein